MKRSRAESREMEKRVQTRASLCDDAAAKTSSCDPCRLLRWVVTWPQERTDDS